MPATEVISEEKFAEIIGNSLGEHTERAKTVFRDYGPVLAREVVNVLLHAIDKEKVDEVLRELEEHWKSTLAFQHPEIRGTVHGALVGNVSGPVFHRIYGEILDLLSEPDV